MDRKRRRTIADTNSDFNRRRKSNSIHAAFRYAASYSDAQASPHTTSSPGSSSDRSLKLINQHQMNETPI
jgi:hypothetical protein